MDIFEDRVLRLSYRKQVVCYLFYLIKNDHDVATHELC